MGVSEPIVVHVLVRALGGDYVAIFKKPELPHCRRNGPGDQKHADDHVTQVGKIQTAHENEETAAKLQRLSKHQRRNWIDLSTSYCRQ